MTIRYTIGQYLSNSFGGENFQDHVGFLLSYGFQLKRIEFAHEPVYFASGVKVDRKNRKDHESR